MNKADFQIRARFRRAVNLAEIPDGSHLLLAVSGGCDSVALLRLCRDEAAARGWKITVGHVDHSLRPDSAAVAAWVAELAATHTLPFLGARVPPEVWEMSKGESLEAEARRQRRRRLLHLAQEGGASWILLGHTLDDQAETVLQNLLRGAGLDGLRGMAACRPPWLRPLLRVRRAALHEYADRQGLAWKEDPTNQDPAFLRNRIRLRLLPLLEQEFTKGAALTLARVAENLRPVRELLAAEADRALARACLEQAPGIIRLERSVLASYDQAIVEELIRRAFRRLRGTVRDLKRAHIEVLMHALQSRRNGEHALPGGITARLDRRELCLLHPREHGGPEDEHEGG